MAKKIKMLAPDKSYVYYDKKSGDLLSITNELNPKYETGFEISTDDVKFLLDGTHKFRDFKVSYKKQKDGTTALAIIAREDLDYSFKNNLFEWISESDENAECTVTWNLKAKRWEFSVDEQFKKTYSDQLLISQLVFFVTLESDLDFLIRSIVVDFNSIMSKDIYIKFENDIETKIDKISISTRIVFKNYKLIKVYE
jgi:hypothetical protein